jgi:hypothetical protein
MMGAPIVGAMAAFALAFLPSSCWAVKSCKVKASRRNGIIYLRATGVSGPLLWGARSAAETRTFTNADECIHGSRATNCRLGDLGTAESITPPPLCTIFVRDSTAECAAHIAGCTAGARGATFGDTRYAGSGVGGIPACADSVMLSIPVTVAAPSRIYAAGSGVYQSGSSSLALGIIRTELTDAAESATLAITGVTLVQTGVFNNPSGVAVFGESSGIMRAGTNAYAAADLPAFVAEPGEYRLKLIVGSSDGICTGSPFFGNAALTYLLVGTM